MEYFSRWVSVGVGSLFLLGGGVGCGDSRVRDTKSVELVVHLTDQGVGRASSVGRPNATDGVIVHASDVGIVDSQGSPVTDQISFQSPVPPLGSGNFDCYGINVIASDIAETPQESTGGHDDPPADVAAIVAKFLQATPANYRTYIGRISNFVPVSSDGSVNLSVSVPQGDNRVVQLIGLLAPTGPNGKAVCPTTVLNSNGILRGDINLIPFILGQRVISHLSSDSDVTMPDDYGNYVRSAAGNAPFRIFTGNDGAPLRLYRIKNGAPIADCGVAVATVTGQAATSIPFSLELPLPVAGDAPVILTITQVEYPHEFYSTGNKQPDSSAAPPSPPAPLTTTCTSAISNVGAKRNCSFYLNYNLSDAGARAFIPASVRVAYSIDGGGGRSVKGESSIPLSALTANGAVPCY